MKTQRRNIFKKLCSWIWPESCAGGICLRERKGHHEIICIMDKSGKVKLPKGRIKIGERTEEAALREFIEETGFYNAFLGTEIATITDRNRGKKITFFRIYEGPGRAHNIRDEAIIWITIEEAIKMLKHEYERQILIDYLLQSK